jgi:hypothetical protein
LSSIGRGSPSDGVVYDGEGGFSIAECCGGFVSSELIGVGERLMCGSEGMEGDCGGVERFLVAWFGTSNIEH